MHPITQFEFITHDSCVFWDDISFYANFGGVVLVREEGENIVRSLGNKKALLLQNHGPLYVFRLSLHTSSELAIDMNMQNGRRFHRECYSLVNHVSKPHSYLRSRSFYLYCY